jgi:uncharacterized protein with GYD domain
MTARKDACEAVALGVYVCCGILHPGGFRYPRDRVRKDLCRSVASKNLNDKGATMALFLTQAAYNDQAWQALVSNPQNRLDAIRPVVEKLGGRIVNAYFAFGDSDFVLITEMPNNVTAAALAIAAAAGGACKSVKTTPLMDSAEGLEAIKLAGTSGYRAPAAAKPAIA